MIKKIGDHIWYYYEYGVDVVNREIFLGSHSEDFDGNESGVNYIMSSHFIKGMSLLSKHPGNITVKMNNPGGDWFHGMAIYDAIISCPHQVTIEVYGMAMSMGAVILQAADKRLMSPHSMFMFHYGTMGTSSTHTKIFKKWSDETEREDEQMEQIFLDRIREKNPTFSLPKLKTMLNFDTIITAQETVEMGLADGII